TAPHADHRGRRTHAHQNRFTELTENHLPVYSPEPRSLAPEPHPGRHSGALPETTDPSTDSSSGRRRGGMPARALAARAAGRDRAGRILDELAHGDQPKFFLTLPGNPDLAGRPPEPDRAAGGTPAAPAGDSLAPPRSPP